MSAKTFVLGRSVGPLVALAMASLSGGEIAAPARSTKPVLTGWHRSNGPPHQGEREKARRRRQAERLAMKAASKRAQET